MKLADWLHSRSITPEQLRRMLGVKDRSTITRWLADQRRPGAERLKAIESITDGAVTATDFDEPGPPACAAVVLDRRGEPRLVFPWTRGSEEQQLAHDSVRVELGDHEQLSGPLARALKDLGGRGWFTPRGVFLLDGKPSDPKRLVRAANAIRTARGLAPIAYPGVHHPEDDR